MNSKHLGPLNESVGCADPTGLQGRLAVKRELGALKKPKEFSKLRLLGHTVMDTSPRTLPGDKTSSFQFDDDEKDEMEKTIIM